MAYNNRNNKPQRISDPNQINYVKTVLEQAEQQTQAAGMHSPEIYMATAQQLANQYSAQDSRYPAVAFGIKDQKLRNQNGSVPEITATIGNQTSSSYFLIKDSLPKGTKASQEQLIQLRPDVVSARIANNLGIVQTPPAQNIPSVPNTAAIPSVPPIGNQAVPQTPAVSVIPNPTPITAPQSNPNPGLSKAQMLAQGMNAAAPAQTPTTNQAPPQTGMPAMSTMPTMPTMNQTMAAPPVRQVAAPIAPPTVAPAPNPAVDAFTQLVTGTGQTEILAPPATQTASVINKNPYANMGTKTNPNPAPAPNPDFKVAPIHNPEMAKFMKDNNQNLQAAGKLNQNIGQALKDMAKGEINPIQIYGDTLNIIGKFLEGVPKGVNDARLAKIAEQMKLVTQKRENINQKMGQLGDNFLESDSLKNNPTVTTTTPVSASAPAPAVTTTPLTPPTSPAPTVSQTKETTIQDVPQWDTDKDSTTEVIDKLLKSNAVIEDKLEAIEKTLDKMLEQLTQIEANLERIEAQLNNQTSPQAPVPNQEGTVTETEVTTEVDAVVVDPEAEVPIKTEIQTEIQAEAKTETEAAQDVEAPEVAIDSPADEEAEINQALIDMVLDFEGDMDDLNEHLNQRGVKVSSLDDGQFISVSEIDNGVISPVFTAEANGEGWEIQSGINADAKLDIVEKFVEAEEALVASVLEPQPEATPEKEEEPCLTMG